MVRYVGQPGNNTFWTAISGTTEGMMLRLKGEYFVLGKKFEMDKSVKITEGSTYVFSVSEDGRLITAIDNLPVAGEPYATLGWCRVPEDVSSLDEVEINLIKNK